MKLDKDPEKSNVRLIEALNTCNIRKDVAVSAVEDLRSVINPPLPRTRP